MKKSTELFVVFFLLGLLELVFWYQNLLPGKVMFMKDLSNEMPYRFFWLHSQGIPLWSPNGFFGIPFAANPQAQAFYPFNFFYLLFGAERGLVFFVVFHHFLFLTTCYAAFRRLGFKLEASLISAIGFGFGGFFCSLTLFILLLTTIAWFPLVIIVLSLAVEKNWIRWSLLLGPIIALQVLAGEVEIAAMSWLLAVIAVGLSPKNTQGLRGMPGLLGALLTGALFGALLSFFQLALFWQMVPLSNRSHGFSLEDALAWSLEFSQIKAIALPSFIISPGLSLEKGIDWGLGFPAKFPYFLSFYAGIIVLALALRGLLGRSRTRSVLWLLLGLFGLAMCIGEQLPLYRWLYLLIPGFKSLRFPVKFYFLFEFATVSLAALGFSELGKKARKGPAFAIICTGIIFAFTLFFSTLPIDVSKYGIAHIKDAMFLHILFRSLALLLIGAGLMFMVGAKTRLGSGLILSVMVFADLLLAHHNLNPPVKINFYTPSPVISQFMVLDKQRPYPARIMNLARKEGSAPEEIFNPLLKTKQLWGDLEGFSPIYLGLDTYRAYGTFHPRDILLFNDMLIRADQDQRLLLFARAGLEYIFLPGSGFMKVNSAFPRASIFYQAQAYGNREEVLKTWSDPGFSANNILLLETDGAQPAPQLESPASEPAQIISYENDRVVVDANARADGWLLLLDSFYPGWKVGLDQKPVEIFRADGFFRGVKIPAGRHRVVFEYRPEIFFRSLWVSGISLVIWASLLVFFYRMD
jgi:hypothetical protein